MAQIELNREKVKILQEVLRNHQGSGRQAINDQFRKVGILKSFEVFRKGMGGEKLFRPMGQVLGKAKGFRGREKARKSKISYKGSFQPGYGRSLQGLSLFESNC